MRGTKLPLPWGEGLAKRGVRGAVFLTLFLMACPPTKSGEDAGREPECSSREQCDAGLVCTSDQYCAQCTTSGQCSVKEVCNPDSRLCVLRDGWGTDCASNDDCQLGSWCKQGLCLARADVSLCPSGLNSDCPDGNRCNQTTLVCEEDLGCSTNFDCSVGEACNVGSRVCQPKCTTDTQATVCPASTRCIGELCLQCEADADCGPGLTCDAAGNCSAGTRCYTDRDCTVPLVCLVQTGACLTKAPACRSDDNCAANQRCDVSSGRCVARDCQPDAYEPNNDDQHAFGVAAGAYRSLTLCAGDLDWYSISLARGDQLGLNLDADSFAENNFSTLIKDASLRTVASGHLLASYVAPTPATYFVVISTSDSFQPYGLNVLKSRGTPCDDDALEPNDSLAQATMLNTATEADGRICPQDQDWFRATVPTSAANVKVSLIHYNAGDGLLRLCLYQSDGVTQLVCTDAAQPVITAPTSVLGGSSLVVRVVGDTERIANSYTLSVEFP